MNSLGSAKFQPMFVIFKFHVTVIELEFRTSFLIEVLVYVLKNWFIFRKEKKT